jgi:hypothetical protein
VIYAIAAYTITLGILSLYGVMLQHRSRVHAADLNAIQTPDALGPPRGFNLGAALLSPFWMWAHGMRVPGAVLFGFWAAIVPLYEMQMRLPLVFIGMVPLAAGAALGFVGNRIAVEHRGAENLAAFSNSQVPWATSGIALYTVILPWLWFFRYAGA